MEEEQDKTVGKHALERKEKNREDVPVLEMQEAVHKGAEGNKPFEEELWTCVERGKQLYPNSPFYIVVMFRRERLMDNVVRQMFLPRRSCPSPQTDQSVWRYLPGIDELEFMWVVPDRETVHEILRNRAFVPLEE